MKVEPLQVSDKVTLHPHWMPADVKVTPRVKPGRVYCVRQVIRAQAVRDATGELAYFIWLVGVRGRPSCTGGEQAVPAEAFQRVGRSSQRQPREEA